MDSALPRLEEPINHRFTWTYAQPDAYHFCKESVMAAQIVAMDMIRCAEDRGEPPQLLKVLDVCAGTGVIGLELTAYVPGLREVDFLEIQAAYRPYFEKNKIITGNDSASFRFIEANYRVLSQADYANRYDVIVANPPYFLRHEGVHSPSELRNRSRFFMDASLEELWLGIANALKPGGSGYVLFRSGSDHGKRDRSHAIRSLLPDVVSWEIHANIRGTYLIKITKRRN